MNPMDIMRTIGKGPLEEAAMQARPVPGRGGDPLQMFRQMLAESGTIPPEQVMAIPDEALMQLMDQVMSQMGGNPGNIPGQAG